jgi:hypothetical protein
MTLTIEMKRGVECLCGVSLLWTQVLRFMEMEDRHRIMAIKIKHLLLNFCAVCVYSRSHKLLACEPRAYKLAACRLRLVAAMCRGRTKIRA